MNASFQDRGETRTGRLNLHVASGRRSGFSGNIENGGYLFCGNISILTQMHANKAQINANEHRVADERSGKPRIGVMDRSIPNRRAGAFICVHLRLKFLLVPPA
jgi:hypothetical protein